jgi:EAL and modified HD-GYP domain-containing signal transduction protein
VGKKTVFINCTHESLAGGHLELIHPDKVVLEVPPCPTPPRRKNRPARARAAGSARTRLSPGVEPERLRKPYASWLPLASFIKLDMQTFKPELAGPLVKFASQYAKARSWPKRWKRPSSSR